MFLFSTTVLLLFAVYFGWTVYRTNEVYRFLKSYGKEWSGKIHIEDPKLGYRSIPNSKGFISFFGENIPVNYDTNGFRVPANYSSGGQYNKPRYLFLGCSLTFGDPCRAEDTFPYLIAEQLGVEVINAGYCSYGLTQMLLLARELIPKHKPDYVIVQYSSWLVDRAARMYAPSYFGKLPAPYFYESNGAMEIADPLYLTKIFSFPIDEYRKTERGVRDFISFMINVSIPLFIYDDFNNITSSIRMRFGLVPEPSDDKERIKNYAYREIYKACKENSCKMIILSIGEFRGDRIVHEKFDVDNDVIRVSADMYLRNNIIRQERKYSPDLIYKYYSHWRWDGKEYVKVDTHPNTQAHRIIANAVIDKIQGLNDSTH